MGEGKCVYRLLVGRSEGKRPPGRPNIKTDLGETGVNEANRIQLAQDRAQQ